jgi:capsular polysaccharide export protein
MTIFQTAVTSSRELANIPMLPNVLGAGRVLPYRSIAGCLACFKPHNTLAVGWGLKQNTAKLRAAAAKRGIPWLTLEDGFFCYASHPSRRAPRYAVISDSVGIYYDATRPSELESILRSSAVQTPEMQKRARWAINFIVQHGISKYGFPNIESPQIAEWQKAGPHVRRVLVADQVFGDCSITHGLATAETFQHMLNAARAENPDAEIVVKLHPDVALGKKKGYLSQLNLEGCTLLRGDISPAQIFPHVHKVYVVTSQIGFEALLYQKPVVCFGVPFYAGWGLTTDKQPTPRREINLSLEALFAGACMVYTKYIIPEKQKQATLEEVLEHLYVQKFLRPYPLVNRIYAVGFSPWKRTFIAEFLRDIACNVQFVRESRLPNFSQLPSNEAVLVWGRRYPNLEKAAQKHGVKLLRAEDGFLRSVGLGSDFRRPASLVFDTTGIYYDPNAPSDLENILERGGFPQPLLNEAQSLRERLVQLKISKYNLSETPLANVTLPHNREIILVPGQVDDDASVQFGCQNGAARSNLELLQKVRCENTNAFVIYKEHPDVASGNRKGKIEPAIAAKLCDLHIHTPCDVNNFFDVVHSVHTMTSLTGFEALLRGKKVTTYGIPFYAGWGLTTDKARCERRTRKLTINELVCGTLILYPRYFNWESSLPAAADTIITKILNEKHQQQNTKPSFLPQGVQRRTRQAKFILESVWGALF